MDTVVVTIEKRHMKLGTPKEAGLCAATFAIREALNLEEAEVSSDEGVWGWSRTLGAIRAQCPKALEEFIAAYDSFTSGYLAAHQLQAVTFTLEVESADAA